MFSTLDPAHVQTGDHVVQFYDREFELVDSVGGYLTAALRAEAAAVVIASPEHRAAFAERLTANGVDVAAAERGGSLRFLDAADTLVRLMPGGRLQPEAFRAVIGGVIAEAASDGRAVCAYGEMVALLWDAGDVVTTIELETLWNDLAGELPFSLYCAYHTDSVAGHEHADALHEVCGLHGAVVPASGAAAGNVATDFPLDPGAARQARHLVADAMREWGHDDELVADAELIATELATNAILHAGTPFRVAVQRFGPGVRISVHDRAAALPALLEPVPLGLSGRGMHLIGGLSRRWGVEVTEAGKTVWAELGR
jgi:anti-sigma regulatory factor (Ser/Thr protein kinase)